VTIVMSPSQAPRSRAPTRCAPQRRDPPRGDLRNPALGVSRERTYTPAGRSRRLKADERAVGENRALPRRTGAMNAVPSDRRRSPQQRSRRAARTLALDQRQRPSGRSRQDAPPSVRSHLGFRRAPSRRVDRPPPHAAGEVDLLPVGVNTGKNEPSRNDVSRCRVCVGRRIPDVAPARLEVVHVEAIRLPSGRSGLSLLHRSRTEGAPTGLAHEELRPHLTPPAGTGEVRSATR